MTSKLTIRQESTGLESQLDELRERSAMRKTPEERVRVEEMIAALEKSVVPAALDVGAEVPDLTLTEAVSGKPVRLRDAFQTGPVVLSFYRGEWCPYCNVEARALEMQHAAISSLGAKVYLVGPETREHALKMQEKSGATIPLLFDVQGEAMDAFRISFELPEAMRPPYEERHGFPARNAGTGWRLPIPATYVIGTDSTIRFRHLDPDYTRRMEPAAIVEILRNLKGESNTGDPQAARSTVTR